MFAYVFTDIRSTNFLFSCAAPTALCFNLQLSHASGFAVLAFSMG